MEQEEKKESLINPISGQRVDEAISEVEAKKRGYLDFEFMMRHLEDENESVKYFVIAQKKVIVHMTRPRYKQESNINHERVLQEAEKKKEANIASIIPVPNTCNIGDEGCVSCGS